MSYDEEVSGATLKNEFQSIRSSSAKSQPSIAELSKSCPQAFSLIRSCRGSGLGTSGGLNILVLIVAGALASTSTVGTMEELLVGIISEPDSDGVRPEE